MTAIVQNKTPRHTFLYVLSFLGISAIAVGSTLILSDGELLGIHPGSGKLSFKGLLIPGTILLLVFGLLPCLLVYSLLNKTENKYAEKINVFKDMHWAWSITIYIVTTLLIWIFVQIVFQGDTQWLYWFYLLLAIVIIFLALIPGVRNLYRK